MENRENSVNVDMRRWRKWGSQLLAVTRYEALLLWRSRGLLVMMLALLALSIVNVLVVNANKEAVIIPLTAGAPDNLTELAKVIVFLMWSPLGITVGLMMPLLLADAMPKDRQIGVGELLESLPVRNHTYLGGKLFGNWLALLIGLAGVLLITVSLWRVMISAFDLMPLLVMYIAGIGALIGINGGLAVVIGWTQPDRRRAIGLVLLLLVIGVLVALPNATVFSETANMLSPLRLPILNYFLLQDVSTGQLLTAIGVGFAQLLIVGMGISGWMKWQAQRR